MGDISASEAHPTSQATISHLIDPIETIRVLHIDDEENQQMFLKVFVEGDSNIKVTSTRNASDTLELVKTGAYDCLITDYDMPDMSGLDLAKRVRETSNIPIIIYTGRGSEEIAEKAFAAGVDDYIRKEQEPAHYQVVSKRIRQAVERKRSSESYRNLFENASDAIYINTLDGNIIDINEAGCRRLGYSKEEIQGKPMCQFMQPGAVDYGEKIKEIVNQGHAIFESTNLSKEGKLVPVEISARVIKYMGSEAILSFSRDISDRKRLEAQMRERLEALQSHALVLSRCEDLVSVARTTYQILHDVMGYSFFGLGVIDGSVLKYILNMVVDDGWQSDYPLNGPGISVRAAKTGTSIIVPDVRLEPDYVGSKTGYSYLSEISVPVKIGESVVAVINVEDETLNRFAREDLMLLEIFSEHISSALHRINLVKSAREYLTKLDGINRHAAHLAGLETEKEVAECSFDVIQELLGFEDGCIGIVEGDVLKFKYARNPEIHLQPDLPLNGNGITVRAFTTGESQIVSDTRLDPDFIADVDPEKYLSELDVPIKIDGRVIGVINLEDQKPGHFSEEDRELVELVSEHIASSLKRIGLLKSVRRYNSNLEALKRHAADLMEIETVEGVAKYSYDVIEELLGFSEGAFGVVDGDKLRYIYAKTIKVEQIPLMPLSGKGISVRAIRTGESQLIPDTRLDEDFVHDVQESDLYSELDVPVSLDGRVIAVINLEKEGINSFSVDDQRVVEILSEQVALAISRIDNLNVISASKEALRQSEVRFKYILDSAPEGVTVNTLCKLVYVNDQFAKMLGYHVEELIGKSIVDLHTESFRELIEERARRRFLGEEVPSQYEAELIRKDGSTLPVEFTISQIIFNGANASLTFIRDISQKAEKLELEKKISSLHAHAHELNELTTVAEVGRTTLDLLENHLNCSFLSVQIASEESLFILATKGAKPIALPMPIQGKGLTARAAREKRPFLVNDTRLDPDFLKGSTESLSELAVPILCKGELLGVLDAESPKLNAFSENDRVLMETLADEVGSAFKRIQSLESEHNYNAKLEALQLNAIKLSQSKTNDEALDRVCEILGGIFRYDWVGIGIVSEKYIKYVRVLGDGFTENNEIPLDRRSVTVRAVKTGKPQLVPNTCVDEDYVVVSRGDSRCNSELVVPIHVNNRVEYIMNLESMRLNAFSGQDKQLIELLSLHLGSTLELVRGREKLNSLHLHASRLESVTDIKEIAELTLNTLKEVMDFKISSFHAVNSDTLEMIGTNGFKVDDKFTQALDGPGVIPYAVRESHSVYVPDVTSDEHYVRGPLNLGEERSSEFVVPIIIDGASVAAINLESSKINGFSDEDRELVELLCEHVASAMRRINQYAIIRASDERYRNLLDGTMDSVIVIQGTRIVYANPAAAKLRGYDSPGEIVGRESTEFIPEDERKMIRDRQLSKQRGETQPVRYCMRLLHRDGSVREVENVASRINFEGKPAVLAVARDLTPVARAPWAYLKNGS